MPFLKEIVLCWVLTLVSTITLKVKVEFLLSLCGVWFDVIFASRMSFKFPCLFLIIYSFSFVLSSPILETVTSPLYRVLRYLVASWLSPTLMSSVLITSSVNSPL